MIKNAPAVGLIDVDGDLSNALYHLAAFLLSIPLAVERSLTLVVELPWVITGVLGYVILLVVFPVAISY
jgi:hypothetical protein